MSQTTCYPCSLCKSFIGGTFAQLQSHQIRGGCMSRFIDQRRAGQLSSQSAILETTLPVENVDMNSDLNVDLNVDMNADIDVDIDVDINVGMESMSNASIGSVDSSLDGNKKYRN